MLKILKKLISKFLSLFHKQTEETFLWGIPENYDYSGVVEKWNKIGFLHNMDNDKKFKLSVLYENLSYLILRNKVVPCNYDTFIFVVLFKLYRDRYHIIKDLSIFELKFLSYLIFYDTKDISTPLNVDDGTLAGVCEDYVRNNKIKMIEDKRLNILKHKGFENNFLKINK